MDVLSSVGSKSSQPEPVVTVRGLRMKYSNLEAVAGIDLDIFPGEVFAFLGPNGAGKTTTVEILEGFRRRTAGDVSVLRVDPGRADATWRSRIGAVLQESEPEAALTVAGLILFFVPLTLLELVRRVMPNPNDNDIARLLLIAFFVYGFLAFSDPRIGRAIERNGKFALALVVPVMATMVSIVVGYGIAEGAELQPWMYAALGPLSMINATLVIVTVLSYGKRYLNADSRALRYLSQASYPFYILHLVPITLIAYFVMQWNLGAVASYLIIVPASFACTFLIYEVVVRRTSVTRFLFGVKQPRKADQMRVERGTPAVGVR